MDKKTFCENNNISEAQFSGEEKISGYLDLRSLTSIPEGFNPTVGGSLDLSSLTSIPEGFNPTVGGSLYLRSLTSIPEGFNPTVGGDLYLRSLTSIPEGFNPTVGGYLDLSSLTSIPEGFNPTVGGYLDLRSLTSIPEGFNPTVGGYLVLKNSREHIGSPILQMEALQINKSLFWNKNGKRYATIDGIFCELLSEKAHARNGEEYHILSAKKVNKDEFFFIANKGAFYAHGEDLKTAFEDLEFKIVAEKLKKEPIGKDTLITVQYYRIITGASKLGCKKWMEQNNITKEEIRAEELLTLLEKTSAYGVDRFKKLMVF